MVYNPILSVNCRWVMVYSVYNAVTVNTGKFDGYESSSVVTADIYLHSDSAGAVPVLNGFLEKKAPLVWTSLVGDCSKIAAGRINRKPAPTYVPI